MTQILIIGASKGIGLETTKQALAAGYEVRAFSRRADKLQLASDTLECWPGDATSAADVCQAMKGINVVVQTLGVPKRPKEFFRPVHLFSDATRVLLQAMEDAAVPKLLAVTGFGAGDSQTRLSCLERIPFQTMLGRVYDDKSRQEALIKQSHLRWTIVRPTFLTNGSKTGRYKILTEPQSWRSGFISRADVADFLVGQLDTDEYEGQSPVLAY